MKDFIYQVPTKFIKENGAEKKLEMNLLLRGLRIYSLSPAVIHLKCR